MPNSFFFPEVSSKVPKIGAPKNGIMEIESIIPEITEDFVIFKLTQRMYIMKTDAGTAVRPRNVI